MGWFVLVSLVIVIVIVVIINFDLVIVEGPQRSIIFIVSSLHTFSQKTTGCEIETSNRLPNITNKKI